MMSAPSSASSDQHFVQTIAFIIRWLGEKPQTPAVVAGLWQRSNIPLPALTALRAFERRLVANEQLQEVLYDLTYPCSRAGTAQQCLAFLYALRWRGEDDDEDPPLRPMFEHLRSLTDKDEWEYLGGVDSEPSMEIFGEPACLWR